MTDAELERALFALPLDEPPAALRGRIFAVTIDRPRVTVASWEIVLGAVLIALALFGSYAVVTAVPDLSGQLARLVNGAVARLLAACTPSTLMWLGAGAAFAYTVSTFSLPAPRRAVHR